jgi:hypothetical protein
MLDSCGGFDVNLIQLHEQLDRQEKVVYRCNIVLPTRTHIALIPY